MAYFWFNCIRFLSILEDDIFRTLEGIESNQAYYITGLLYS